MRQNSPQTKREGQILNLFSHLHDIVAAIVEELYDHNVTCDVPQVSRMLGVRLEFHVRLEEWRQSLPYGWTIPPMTTIGEQIRSDLNLCWPQVLLSIYYHRCQMLMNRPVVLHSVKSWLLSSETVPDSFVEDVLPVMKSDMSSATALFGIIRSVNDVSSLFLRTYGAWFTANYSGKRSMLTLMMSWLKMLLVFTASVHLFAHALFSVKPGMVLSEHGPHTFEAQKELREALAVLRAVGSTSLMSQKGAACLLSLLDVLVSFGRSSI